MSQAAKVTQIHSHTVQEEAPVSVNEVIEVNTSKDMGKVALVVAIISVLLVVISFYAVNRSVHHMEGELKGVAEVKTDVLLLKKQMTGVEGQVTAVNGKIAQLEKLPAQAKKMVVAGMVQEMAQKASYLSGQVESADQAAKLQQAMELLTGVQAEMSK
jgi:hypothetical protein